MQKGGTCFGSSSGSGTGHSLKVVLRLKHHGCRLSLDNFSSHSSQQHRAAAVR